MVAHSISPPIDVEAFPIDRSLPQVRIASDETQMRELFRRYLRPCSSNTYEIQDCTLTRLRHRQAARCILQYNLRLVDSSTGQERTQWVSGSIYPRDRAEHIWQRLRATDLGLPISRAFQTFEPVSFVPELKMLVQLFPYDRRLPAVPFLVNGPSSEMEALLLSRFGPGRWNTEAWDVEPIRYRSGLAVVLKYTVRARDRATGRKEERRFYAKIYRDKKGEQVYQVLQQLWLRRNEEREYFTIGQPVAYLSRLHALVQEEVPGIFFHQILLHSRDNEADSAARKIARALATLHLDDISTTRNYLVKDEVAVLGKTTKTLGWAAPHLKEDVAAIVRAIIASLEEVPLRPAHLDLKTDHILLHGKHCNLLDLDSFALADPVQDAADILAQIFGMKFRNSVPRDRLRMAANSFAEEYFNHTPGDWRGRLRPRYASAALKVALGFFRRQEPQWPNKVAELVEEARASLADRRAGREFLAR